MQRVLRDLLIGNSTFWSDVRAVSSIIGGILFLGIVVVAMVNFRVAVVPMLDEQREAVHMSAVGDRMATIKSEADRQVDYRGRPAVTTAVPLKPAQTSGLLTDGTSASYLMFDPGGRTATMESKELLIQVERDSAVFGPDETWTNITSGDQMKNLTQVQHLRVRIEDPQGQSDGDNVTIIVTDAAGKYAGKMEVYITTHPSGYSINVHVLDAENDTLYDQGNSFFNQDKPAFYWVDALADEVQFYDVLRATEDPFTLTFDNNNMQGAFTIVYYEDTEVGPILVGGAGKFYPDWSHSDVGGVLKYQSHNIHFIRQDLYLEAGGIIVDQPVGNTFFMEPSLDVQNAGDRTVLRLTAPALTGGSEMHSGQEPVPVRIQGLSQYDIVGTAPHFGYNVSTEHPQVWLNFWKAKFDAAGFDEAGGGVAFDSGTDWARFDFYGKTTDPASLEHDVALEVHAGRVQVVMRG